MLERIEMWYEKTGKRFVRLLFWLIGIYVFWEYVLELIIPFVIAWGFSCLLNPIVTWLKKRCKVPRAIGTLISMTTILSGLIGLLTFLIRQLWIQIEGFTNSFEIYRIELMIAVGRLEGYLQRLGDQFPVPTALSSLDELVSEMMNYIGGFLDEIVKGMYVVVTQLPNGFFFIMVVSISVFFMTKDHRKIKSFIKVQIPEYIVNKIVIMQKGLRVALGGYVRTQLILMCMTFVICLAGLLVLGRQYSLLIALGIAIFDALPVFGSGAILIPWGVYHMVLGNYTLGIGLFCVYALVVVMRQIMEPKVLSAQIGVYALVTVIAMYVGLKTMGLLGMIGGPILVVMLTTLQQMGVIPAFKSPPKKED
ncbi:MAG: sporulation integral membrane protein YtvI [Cellulosilyticaceae bacterium]